MTAKRAPSIEEAIAGTSEFPAFMGPVLIKEFRQGLWSSLFIWPFVLIPLVLAVQALWAMAVADVENARTLIGVFLWMGVIVPTLVIAPLRGLGAIRGERGAQTLELLQMSPLSAWRIVLAKWSSLVCQSVLWTISLLPFFVLQYFFGGVDLIDQMAGLLWTLLFSAVLIAVTMVLSTLPRLVFWLAVAGLIFFGGLGLVASIDSYSRSILGFTLGPGGLVAAAFIGLTFNLVYLTLTVAASRIAPPADNYAMRIRLGTLFLFGWWVLASPLVFGPGDFSSPFGGLAIITAMIVGVFDLTSDRAPLATHLRPWSRFGKAGRAIGCFFLPGWPSAFLFFNAILGIAALFLWYFDEAGKDILMVPLMGMAVMLPRVILSLLNPRRSNDVRFHIIVHGAGGVFSVVLYSFMFLLGDVAKYLSGCFPSAMFWLNLEQWERREDLQIIGVSLVVWGLISWGMFFWRSRDYWKTARERAVKKSPVPTS